MNSAPPGFQRFGFPDSWHTRDFTSELLLCITMRVDISKTTLLGASFGGRWRIDGRDESWRVTRIRAEPGAPENSKGCDIGYAQPSALREANSVDHAPYSP